MNIPSFDLFGLVVCITGLFVTWKDINVRYIFFCCIFVSVLSLLTLQWALTKPILFYVWSMSMSALFLVLLLGRRYWAFKFEKIRFFSVAYEEHRYTPQEITLVIISIICVLSNLITFLEVYLYWIDWIENAYFKLYVRDYLQKFMSILSVLVCFTLVFKTSRKFELSSKNS